MEIVYGTVGLRETGGLNFLIDGIRENSNLLDLRQLLQFVLLII